MTEQTEPQPISWGEADAILRKEAESVTTQTENVTPIIETPQNVAASVEVAPDEVAPVENPLPTDQAPVEASIEVSPSPAPALTERLAENHEESPQDSTSLLKQILVEVKDQNPTESSLQSIAQAIQAQQTKVEVTDQLVA